MTAPARRLLGRCDPWLLLAVVLLALLGVLVLASGDGAPPRLSGTALRHAAIAVAGVFTTLALAHLDYRVLRRLAPPVYVGTVLALLAVLALGAAQYGARRWLGAGGLTIQPAELAKPALAVAVAAYLADREPRPRALITALALVAAPLLLVLAQPDTGTALVLAAVCMAAVVAWGAPWRLLGALTGAAVALVPLAFAVAVPDYQRERIAVFFDPARDPLGSGFNLQRAEAALRSGGLTGHGLLGGSPSVLQGMGARSNDFMFAQVGERIGLLGGLLLLAIFALLLWRGLRAAAGAPDAFGRLLAVAATIAIVAQAGLHIAVNLRLFPATGIPLPFISQGGSSLLALCVAAGLIQSVAAQRPATPREQWTGARWR